MIAFGGPAAHIAMMDAEVVRRRGWLTREQFLDLLGATNLIPGPNSTEMAIDGLVRAGWRGLIVAGTCFILPAMLIVLLNWSSSYGSNRPGWFSEADWWGWRSRCSTEKRRRLAGYTICPQEQAFSVFCPARRFPFSCAGEVPYIDHGVR